MGKLRALTVRSRVENNTPTPPTPSWSPRFPVVSCCPDSGYQQSVSSRNYDSQHTLHIGCELPAPSQTPRTCIRSFNYATGIYFIYSCATACPGCWLEPLPSHSHRVKWNGIGPRNAVWATAWGPGRLPGRSDIWIKIWVMGIEKHTCWDEHWVPHVSREPWESTPKSKSTLYTPYVVCQHMLYAVCCTYCQANLTTNYNKKNVSKKKKKDLMDV